MKELIKAFGIFSKYCDEIYPTKCNDGELRVTICPSSVETNDLIRLEDCFFYPDLEKKEFVSYRFGGK